MDAKYQTVAETNPISRTKNAQSASRLPKETHEAFDPIAIDPAYHASEDEIQYFNISDFNELKTENVRKNTVNTYCYCWRGADVNLNPWHITLDARVKLKNETVKY